MTNNHIIGNNDLILGKRIKFTLDNDRKQKEIILDEKRKKYSSEKYDITIIEIKKNDGIEKESFFEIDNQIFTDYKIYIKQSVYLLHYPKGKEMKFSCEIINSIYEDGYTIQHYCDSDDGSSGGPLLNSIDYKVIGIHKGGAKGAQQFNLGTLIKEPIEDFKRKINEKEVANSIEQTKIKESKNVDKTLNIIGEGHLPDIMNLPKASIIGEGHLPDIMNLPNASVKVEKYNNIIYYDSNAINQDYDLFEKATDGAFILCTNIDSLKLVINEIDLNRRKDKRFIFNLIIKEIKRNESNIIMNFFKGNETTKISYKIMEFLQENKEFDDCIQNICVLCKNNNEFKSLQSKYIKFYGVYSKVEEAIEFIKHFSSKEIKPYPITKVITYDDYKEKYKDRHFAISKYYGDLTLESYQINIEKIKYLIEEDNTKKELFNRNKEYVLNGFLAFDIKKDLEILDKLIIKEYTKNTIYGDLNKWLRNMNLQYNSFEPVAYFAARLMYSSNSYGGNGNYYNKNREVLFRGCKLPFTDLLQYKKAKEKVILFPAFTTTNEDIKIASHDSGRNNSQLLYKTKKQFSVLFFITNYINKKGITNGVNIQNISAYDEKEILFLPYSFYYVRDVIIDLNNYKADIYLDTIGKYEVLEEQIKKGKDIIFNKNERVMEVIK